MQKHGHLIIVSGSLVVSNGGRVPLARVTIMVVVNSVAVAHSILTLRKLKIDIWKWTSKSKNGTQLRERRKYMEIKGTHNPPTIRLEWPGLIGREPFIIYNEE